MPQHKVKCYYCGEEFDANSKEFGKIGRFYAHKECGDKNDWQKISKVTKAAAERDRVKCLYCNKLFYKSQEPYKQVGNRYAHEACYNKYHEVDDDYKDKIYELVKQIFGPGYQYFAIEAYRAKFLRDGITNQEIYQALYYFYIVQKHSTEKAHGNIGIVPYVVDDANSYFENIKKYSDKVSASTFKMGSKIINVQSNSDDNENQKNLRGKFYIDPNTLKDLE